MENHAENLHQKVVPEPFLILVNNNFGKSIGMDVSQ